MQLWNLDGNLVDYDKIPVSLFNRSLYFGDSLTEPLWIQDGFIPFWEEHYFHLMASMRKLRYAIPMEFTPEYLEQQCLELWEKAGKPAKLYLEIQVVRSQTLVPWSREGGLHFLIHTVEDLPTGTLSPEAEVEECELYKDHYLPSGLLANLSTPMPAAITVAHSFAIENGYADCALLNESKQVVRALSGLIFIASEDGIKIPELAGGAPAWVVRKQALILLDAMARENDWSIEEVAISPFEIPKAKEVFTLDPYGRLYSWKKYRKTVYQQFSWKERLEEAFISACLPKVEKEES